MHIVLVVITVMAIVALKQLKWYSDKVSKYEQTNSSMYLLSTCMVKPAKRMAGIWMDSRPMIG